MGDILGTTTTTTGAFAKSSSPTTTVPWLVHGCAESTTSTTSMVDHVDPLQGEPEQVPGGEGGELDWEETGTIMSTAKRSRVRLRSRPYLGGWHWVSLGRSTSVS